MPRFTSSMASARAEAAPGQAGGHRMARSDLPQVRLAIIKYLRVREQQIASVAAEHVGVKHAELVQLATHDNWVCGRSTLCVPFTARAGTARLRGLVQLPFPDTQEAEEYPASVGERVRCEAGTHLWMNKTCPDVALPTLYGFGLPGGGSFTVNAASDDTRPALRHHDRDDMLPKLGYTVVSDVLKGNEVDGRSTGSAGVLLSAVWDEHRHDTVRRGNLLGNLVDIMLKMAQHEHARIGSLVVDDNGAVGLTNRPLTRAVAAAGVPVVSPPDMARRQTYSCVDPYVLDLIQGGHDRRVLHPDSNTTSAGHPRNFDDSQVQVAALTMMRALLPRFLDPRMRDGPFALTMTDLGMDSVVVDPATWRVTSLLNLGWPVVRPLEMLQPPLWLGNAVGSPLASVVQDAAVFQAYADAYQEYTQAIMAASARLGNTPAAFEVAKLAQLLQDALVTGRFWYVLALDHPAVLDSVFVQRIQPLFVSRKDGDNVENDGSDGEDGGDDDRQFRFADAVAPFWRRNAVHLLERKVAGRLAHDGGHLHRQVAEAQHAQQVQRNMTRQYAHKFLRLHKPQIVKMCALYGDELVDAVTMTVVSLQRQSSEVAVGMAGLDGSFETFGTSHASDSEGVASIETNGSRTDSVAAETYSNDDEAMYDDEEEEESSSEDEEIEDDKDEDGNEE